MGDRSGYRKIRKDTSDEKRKIKVVNRDKNNNGKKIYNHGFDEYNKL